jgi:hypothetical protein
VLLVEAEDEPEQRDRDQAAADPEEPAERADDAAQKKEEDEVRELVH